MDIKIRQFSQQELAMLSRDIQAALDGIKSKYGLAELSLGGIRFNFFSFTARITGRAQNEATECYERNEATFFAEVNGLPHDFIGSEFYLDGSVFKITGLYTSRPKYPISAHCQSSGRTYKFTTERIRELLKTARVITYREEEPGKLNE